MGEGGGGRGRPPLGRAPNDPPQGVHKQWPEFLVSFPNTVSECVRSHTRTRAHTQPNPLISGGTCALSGNKSAQKKQLIDKTQGRLSLLRGTVTRGKGVMRVLFTQVHTIPGI